MRIEDLDGPRVKPESERSVLETLEWVGMDWDGPVLRQSDDLAPYRKGMRRLTERRLAFPCALSRSEIEAAASAPHAGDHESCYPRALRPDVRPTDFQDEQTNWRFVADDGVVDIDDLVAGHQERSPASTVGDFVIWTRRGQPAYQLAVVVDDHRQGVTDVIRGDDLLDSAARQIQLADALGLEWRPRYWHLPLVLGPDGRRLAKRHGDTRVVSYREAGVTPARLVGLIAAWSGVADQPEPMTSHEFAARFDIANLSRNPVTFTTEDDAWLRG